MVVNNVVYNMNTETIITISMIISTVSLIIILLYLGVNLKKIKFIQTIALYVIITLGVYFSIIMFDITSSSIKADILDTIKNTKQYNGFIEPIYALIIVFIGIIVGVLIHYLVEHVRNLNFKNKNR